VSYAGLVEKVWDAIAGKLEYDGSGDYFLDHGGIDDAARAAIAAVADHIRVGEFFG
jgi:hypothetical protein